MSAAASVLDLKNKLSGDDYEKVPAERQRLIYSGRVMKNEDPLSAAATGGVPRAAAGVPTNMAAGTANNPLAGLTGARYAGHMALPGAEMFGADGGMGAPPNEDQMAQMLDDPNVQQSLNEALNNPAMIDMMIQSVPGLRDNPQARQMLESPEFRQMMTNPETLRQAARMQRVMQGGGMGGAAGGFPAPGVTDTTPGANNAGTNATPNSQPPNPFAMFGAPGAGAGAAGGNPFAALMGGGGAFGRTPAQTPPAPGSAGGQGTPSAEGGAAPNPFGSMFGGGGAGGNPFAGMPPPTPEQMQQALQMMGMGGAGGPGGNLFGNLGGAASPPPPADTRPPEEQYADQLRQLNDMGFFDFDRNVAALRRSGGSVQEYGWTLVDKTALSYVIFMSKRVFAT
ncbi:putative Ubiquitin domain-containing protein DSK2 [Glarea lozoyensis 74030]|uniref:Putative Ubiquitin domain-containing protein DSK2 n=1 Tax=Glarea lozoyensis (strain ATCC 74030 / MF5533) TaxID=1104152 RepID=H0EH40_GLAL7|nr:putative Ubiquitin domain-containing protein DSK2 [Glarea lozoyensis 74030]